MVTYIIVNEKTNYHDSYRELSSGDWNKEQDIEPVSLIKLKDCENTPWHDVAVQEDLKAGQEYFLITVIYTTGDSFGYSRGNMSYVHVTELYELAKTIKDEIGARYAKYKYEGGKSDEAYKKFEVCGVVVCPSEWIGYFESIEEIRITKLLLVDE